MQQQSHLGVAPAESVYGRHARAAQQGGTLTLDRAAPVRADASARSSTTLVVSRPVSTAGTTAKTISGVCFTIRPRNVVAASLLGSCEGARSNRDERRAREAWCRDRSDGSVVMRARLSLQLVEHIHWR